MNARTKLLTFGAYTKALEPFDFVVADMALLSRYRECSQLAAQQLASADSIASNIEEGYGRGSKKAYCQFLVLARGSAKETAGRCLRLGHWLPADLPAGRIALCDEIIGILTASILKLRSRLVSAK